MHVKVAGIEGVASEEEAVDDAGLAGAVRPEDQRQRLDRDPLGIGERLEVPQPQLC